ncbi:helix-turn-helix transcriptional regulator [Burkholderia cenocepacia]|uniref:helix-turn-helix domain-containing protein n=1 Tax=Burkholderia cenocepacia TaxID=95486 RepID=UPI001B9E0745|nr:AraC family transcriptional regulator [Burkholderia cenocepacia]MBR8159299.1 helix-turn-helix transcriptional regulator [Burkholderia cenocepacia]
MSRAIKIFQGRFGRVALLDMDKPLVPHAHHHCHALIKVSGPDTFFSVRGNLQPLTAETVVLVNAWEPHAYACHRPEIGNTVLLALYIEPGWLAEIQRQLTVSAHPHFFPNPCVAVSPQARKLADELAGEMLVSDIIPTARLESQLFELMISIIDRNSEWRNSGELLRATRGQTIDPRIRRAIALMRENIGNTLDMDQLAAQCGLSRAHFFALFRRSTNLTPNVYANVLRMESAIHNLTASNVSLADISLDIGFSAQAHFTRFFREHLGTTPSEYRRVVDVIDPVVETRA